MSVPDKSEVSAIVIVSIVALLPVAFFRSGMTSFVDFIFLKLIPTIPAAIAGILAIAFLQTVAIFVGSYLRDHYEQWVKR